MNLDPPVEFDPSEELSRLGDPAQQHYGLSERLFFYLVRTCRTIESFGELAFFAEPVDGGCRVEFIVHGHAFWVDTSPTRVRLWAGSIDGVDASNRYLVHDRDASDPKSWEDLLIEIGRVEKFGVHINLADTLRHEWSLWLVEQKRRDDERGW
jgi:hypothetical protein